MTKPQYKLFGKRRSQIFTPRLEEGQNNWKKRSGGAFCGGISEVEKDTPIAKIFSMYNCADIKWCGRLRITDKYGCETYLEVGTCDFFVRMHICRRIATQTYMHLPCMKTSGVSYTKCTKVYDVLWRTRLPQNTRPECWFGVSAVSGTTIYRADPDHARRLWGPMKFGFRSVIWPGWG